MTYQVEKTFTHSNGWSCAFRQWKADSHCAFVHGYALQIEITFESETLNEKNWVVDFGGFKMLKQWLTDTFDHKTIVAKDDPLLPEFAAMRDIGMFDLVIVDAVGCEKFAEMIASKAASLIPAKVKKVTVREHQGNAASIVF